ncbi:hypothetical protein [Actinomadura oligospora]|uniref:hypothetical protein n=1 Tax=Actinomadura oligospora TaxID=111804 RepID=UPI00047B285E|nr:hypothetical protein [Actinomadura oligospora]
MTRSDRHPTSITDQAPPAAAPGRAAISSPPAQTSHDLGPLATAWREALDVAELQENELRMRRARLGIASVFFTSGAAITVTALATLHPVPHLPTVTISAVPAAIVAVAALAGLTRLFQDLAIRFTASYQVTQSGWRWQVSRRWYAPGSYARLRQAPQEFVVVLGWAHDPACAQPWVLIQQDGESARWAPLSYIRSVSGC